MGKSVEHDSGSKTDLTPFLECYQLLHVAYDAGGRHDELVQEYEHDNAKPVPPHFQTQHVEDLFLFPVHHKDDKERQRQDEQGQRAHDIKPPCHGEFRLPTTQILYNC